MMRREQAAQQLRRALQMLAVNLPDEKALEVVTVFDPWEAGKRYVAGELLSYGVNGVDDPQLYRVLQNHTAQADWTPDTTPALYAAVGLDDTGYPLWTQPLGAQDAYNTGDIVNYGGVLYRSVINGNVYSPEVYPAGWEVYEVQDILEEGE